MKSSWSCPHWPWPLAAKTPMTRKGRFLMRMTWPTGESPSGKRVRATVAPSRHTLSAERTSRVVKLAPSAITQLRTGT